MSQKIEASLNNYIGQKILTYIYDGTHLTQELKDKFKKSLIFLGYEGQIYNPLTNTYIGIGTTAYTNIKKYIKNVDDKVDALNQALTASLVSALYANFNDEELNKLTYYTYIANDQYALDNFKNKTAAGIHATNEIIFKGIGDYDPETHQATAKEYIHVTSENVNATQQELLTYSYFVNNERNNNPFATSGITVSLTKGRNIYRFNSKFLYNEDLHVGTYTIPGGETLSYDIPESLWFEAAGNLTENGQVPLSSDGYEVNTYTEAWAVFKNSLQAYNIANKYTYTFEDLYAPALDNSNAQVYKNGKNVMTIDDKLTWSYIANAYAYTLDFTQKFTTNEVNRIYSEILGLSANNALIPVDAATIRNVIEDNNSYVFDANTGEFLKLESDTDNGLLYQTVLNTETKYYQKLYFNKDEYCSDGKMDYPEYDGANSSYEDEEGNSIFSKSVRVSQIPVLGDGEILNSYLYIGKNSIKLYANLDDAIANRDGEDYNISTYNVAGWTYITSGNLTSRDILVQGPQEKGGAEYATDNEIEVYGGNYLLRLVTDLSQVSDEYDYVVVNKFNAENYNVNLSDGINTLKEAAYILDWITNGSMDPMNPEASGIEMAYSIAQNHIDIERLHDRLSKVEGGLNVVNNIKQLENGTHDYAYLNIKSNKVAYLTESSEATSAVIQATGLFQNTGTEYDPHGQLLYKKVGTGKTDYIAVLDSQVLEWNRLMTAYNTDLAIADHVAGTSKPVAPVFADIFGDAVDNDLYLVTTTTANGVVESSYVGEISLGVDLLTATTYTLHKYGHHSDTDGYVPVTINDVNKTTYITVAVPTKIPVVDYVNASFNKYRYSVGDEIDYAENNEIWKSINPLLENRFNINVAKWDGRKYIVGNNDYNDYLPYSIDDSSVFLKLVLDTNNLNDSVSIKEVKYVIDTKAASNAPYDGVLYVKTGDTYALASFINNEIIGDLNSSALYDTYYFRYSPVNDTVKFAYLSDGLATTEWVQAYTYHSIKDLDGKFIESKVDSYNYAKQLINGLDSDANVRAGNTISSIKIENGRVSVSQTELPTDKIRINSTVWGEDTNTLKQYSAIDGNQVTESIALSHPIYVQYGHTYVLNPTFNNFDNAFTLVNGSDRKFDLYSNVAVTVNPKDERPEKASYIYNNSLSYGVDFAHYLPIYEKVNAYVAIDPADLVVTVTEKQDQPGSYVYNYTYSFNGKSFAYFYKLSDSQPASSSVEYLTGSVVHHDATNGGKGENTIHLTAHITKIADANKGNTGLVDAYDVRETLSNMFEWVDLSEWTDKAVDTQNPLNHYGGERTTLPPTDVV